MFQWRDYAHAYRNQQIRYRSYKPYFNHRQQSVTIAALKYNEPIAGYTVMERIGAGGYGEVWKVEAPGGLEKAIKFVYGHLDEIRAEREMKALNRIKDVRHPFLLSLERIEVVEGQLIIVTELADASLKDLFDELRKSEERGIPRDKLLVYLGDAADALDYMSENHSLQHMDIKPENLLLVGGRVKVADFGLVKELRDVTVSLMGGLTPIYAPPEVFDGQPSRFSDQYSLAIVYQELLTGCLPFPGTTAAQLATQHLSSPPQLSALPNADQAIIAKALSKNPDDRFESCRQLVDMLGSAGQATASPVIGSNANQINEDNRDTPTVERTAQPPARPQQKQRLASKRKLPQRVATPEVRNSPPVEINLESVRLQPTVFVALGGTAGQALLRLRSRLCERFGSTENVPALRMVAIDTDAKALSCLTQSDSSAAFDPGDVVPTPLRQSQQYRQRSDQLTRSISRRWLFNIPRSLQTNGMRPLGRLALMDHSRAVDQRIRTALESVTTAEAIEATEETTGIQLSPEPRVVLISSISGGCGSGMVLDVAYMLRKLLGELGADEHRICGILAHSTPRNTDGKDLAIANAFACLSELQHYCRADHYYPGDPMLCGLPPFTPDIAPFDDTYIVHLGDDLNEEQLQSASDCPPASRG